MLRQAYRVPCGSPLAAKDEASDDHPPTRDTTQITKHQNKGKTTAKPTTTPKVMICSFVTPQD